MDSITIKNYLMDFIFEIMEREEFKQMFESVGSKDGKLRKINKDEMFDIYIVYDAFLVFFFLI